MAKYESEYFYIPANVYESVSKLHLTVTKSTPKSAITAYITQLLGRNGPFVHDQFVYGVFVRIMV
jgi:hypothetical protein